MRIGVLCPECRINHHIKIAVRYVGNCGEVQIFMNSGNTSELYSWKCSGWVIFDEYLSPFSSEPFAF